MTSLPHFVIVDRNIGNLQWSGQAASEMDALRAFDADVMIDPHGEGLEAIAEDFRIYQVTPEQRKAVETWWDNGCKTEFPEID